MSNVIEVVFENVLKIKVIKLLMFLKETSGRLVNVQCSEDIELMKQGDIDVFVLDSLLNFEGNVSVLLNLSDMKIGDIILPNILLRLVKYGGYYDIDFNFDSEDIENIDIMAVIVELHHYVKEVAREYNISNFFCGVEPASDQITRYFTNESLGPLANWLQ